MVDLSCQKTEDCVVLGGCYEVDTSILLECMIGKAYVVESLKPHRYVIFNTANLVSLKMQQFERQQFVDLASKGVMSLEPTGRGSLPYFSPNTQSCSEQNPRIPQYCSGSLCFFEFRRIHHSTRLWLSFPLDSVHCLLHSGPTCLTDSFSQKVMTPALKSVGPGSLTSAG